MVDIHLNAFIKLSNLFEDNHFHLYLVGGTVRDYLLHIPLTDMDAVTDATPEEMKAFLDKADYTFAKFGSVKYKMDDIKFDITTLRSESGYIDSRHPAEIKFVKNLSIDVKRRDFTVNALYLDKELKVIDLVDGVKDINNRTLRMLGNPDTRIKEDPLRITRALRFTIDYDLTIEKELEKAILDNVDLLDKLNIDKVKQDLRKMKCRDLDKIKKVFTKFNFIKWLSVLE